MTKFAEIQLMMTSKENKNLHFVSLCETKLKSNKLSSVFHVPGFLFTFQLPFRKDNQRNGSGGILVYIRDHIMAKRRADLETNKA